MIVLILIVLGLCLGSFLNAFVWRHYKRAELLERKGKKATKKELADLSIATGRSRCTHCKHTLAPIDLIPVVSYLWLRGKCRYCGKKIEDTPLAELLTPLLFVVSYLFWPSVLHGQALFLFVSWLVFCCGFVALTLYDLRWFLLPHSIVLPLIGLAVLRVLITAFGFHGGVRSLLQAALGAVIIGGLFYLLFRISNERWIGGGDVTLGVLLGLLAAGPAEAFLLIFLASLLGTLVAAPMLIVHKASRTTHLPFGPFLMAAAVITVLFGQHIVHWYTNLFLPL